MAANARTQNGPDPAGKEVNRVQERIMKKLIDVAAAVILKDNKVFAARRRKGAHLSGYWEFPGGKLEDGETPEQCLARELKEELNINVRIGPYIGESVFDYGIKIIRLIAYEVEHLSGAIELVDHDEMRWLSFNELSAVKWAPADIPLVEQLKNSVL